MAPTVFRRHRERGGESPPSSSSSLTLPLDVRRVSPLVHGLQGGRGAIPPPRLDLSLCLSLFLRWLILPFHRFLNSRRSVTPIGLNFGNDFYPDISFLAAKEGHQPPYGVATRVRGVPAPLRRAPLPRGPLGHHLAWIFLPKNHIYSKKSPSGFLLFGLRLIWVYCETKNMQQTGTGTGHWINMLVPK